jgi:uncharacterized protein YigA (DUF484 family)
MSAQTVKLKLTEEQVAEFLLNQRGFFVRHPQLLDQLHLPHKREAGAAEFQNFQTKSLRRQIDLLKDQLYSLVSVAGDNAQLYVKLHQLTLLLLASEQPVADLPHLINEVFQLDAIRLWWFDERRAPDADERCAVVYGPESAFWTNARLARLAVDEPECGAFEPDLRDALLGDGSVTSLCILPLGEHSALGVLVLGSYGDRFSIEGEKVFLTQLMQLLSVILTLREAK